MNSTYSALIAERYSVRKFSTEPVDQSLVQSILEAAQLAPTAVNKQPQRILVLRTAAGMEKLKKATTYTFNAPMALIVCYNMSEAWVRPFDRNNAGVIDATIVATHIMLKVHDIGLGTTWVGHFDPAVLRREFDLPPDIEPIAVFPIGHPAVDAKPSPQHTRRRPLEETVVYEHF
ncbi:MAG: nitroreductase family protein [Desulfovibrio sp.]|nr:nitroreductase family protein [Desulfovibrio sp.]